jgi:hypothetical protein
MRIACSLIEHSQIARKSRCPIFPLNGSQITGRGVNGSDDCRGANESRYSIGERCVINSPADEYRIFRINSHGKI